MPVESAEGRRLRVLECLTYYLPHRTGLTLHVQRLAEGLAARGHTVTVLSARFHPGLAAREQIAGVEVRRLWAPLRVSRGVVMPAYPLALWRLTRAHDVVHVHSPMLETGLAGIVSRLARRPLVITHHGDLVLPAGAFNRFVQEAVHALYLPGARAARAIVAYSADYAGHSRYLRPFEAKVCAVLPPVAVAAPRPEAVAALRRRWGLEGRRVVGYAGRFVEEKRPDVLLEAMPAVRAAFPDAVAVFAGQRDVGYERFFEACRPLVERAGPTVRFAGLLTEPEELAAFYAACDVLVLASQTECFGLVQAEAMLCGTPVVASDVPGARVPVRLTGMGLLVPPGEPAALAAAISAVLADPAAFAGRRPVAEEVFDLERTLDAHEAVLRAAAGGTPGGSRRG